MITSGDHAIQVGEEEEEQGLFTGIWFIWPRAKCSNWSSCSVANLSKRRFALEMRCVCLCTQMQRCSVTNTLTENGVTEEVVEEQEGRCDVIEKKKGWVRRIAAPKM